jgi:hypothetical protein
VRGRRGGKTEEELQGALRDAVVNPGLHWICGPKYKQIKSIAWSRLKVIIKPDPRWKINEQELYIEHPDIVAKDGRNTRIELKGCDNEDSLVGVGLRSLRVDEAALVKAGVWENILRPMLADYQAPASFYSTPRGRNWFYDLYQRGLGDDANWKSWRQPTRINKYIKPEEIEEAKKDMSARLFRQEFDAEFLDDDTGVFRKIRQCIVGEFESPIEGRFYVMGVDLAKSYDFTVLTVVDSVTRKVVARERFQDVSWTEQKSRILYLAHKYNDALAILDSTGVGDPIAEDLQSSNISLHYEDGKPGVKFDNRKKCQIIDNLVIAIEQRAITFPSEYEELISELQQYEYTITDAGNITYSAPDGKHDDCVISLALAVWAIKNNLKESQIIQKFYQDEEDSQGGGEVVKDEREETSFSWI